MQRQFRTDRRDAVWLTDITEHPTAEGKLYLCAIKDCFSNRIVGYSIGDRMTAQLACSALRSAELTESMGRVGAAGDNAAMESFYSLVQKNVLDRRRRWRTRAELRYELVVWIEHTYNRRRRRRALGKLTPVEFELAFTPQPDDETTAEAA